MAATPDKPSKTRFSVIGSCFLAALTVAAFSFVARIEPIMRAKTVCAAVIRQIELSFDQVFPFRRGVSAKQSCSATMKQIDGAKVAWMIEHHKSTNDSPTWQDLVGPDGYLRKIPQCPHGGTYTVGAMSEPPACSIVKDNEYYQEAMGLQPAVTTDTNRSRVP
jgi:hypothetical protein